MYGLSRVKKIQIARKQMGIVEKIRIVKLKEIGTEMKRTVIVVTMKAIEVKKVAKIQLRKVKMKVKRTKQCIS